MAKSAAQYRREMEDQPGIRCVVCGVPVLIKHALHVDLKMVKGLKGRPWTQLKVSDMDGANAGLCPEHPKRITDNGGEVRKLDMTLKRLSEMAEAEELAAEAAERKRLEDERKEASRRAEDARVLSNFTFGDVVLAKMGISTNGNGQHAKAAVPVPATTA